MEHFIFGYVGLTFSIIYKLPQIYLLYKKKNITSISFKSLIIQIFSYMFYIVHGIFISDLPVLLLGIVSFFQTFILICQYYYYSNNNIQRLECVAAERA